MNRKDYYFGLAVLTDLMIYIAYVLSATGDLEYFFSSTPYIGVFFYGAMGVIVWLILDALKPRILKVYKKNKD